MHANRCHAVAAALLAAARVSFGAATRAARAAVGAAAAAAAAVVTAVPAAITSGSAASTAILGSNRSGLTCSRWLLFASHDVPSASFVR